MSDSQVYINLAKDYIGLIEQRQSTTDQILGSLAIASALVAIAERLAPLELQEPTVSENLLETCPECLGRGAFGEELPGGDSRGGEPTHLEMCLLCNGSGQVGSLVIAPPKPASYPVRR